MAPTKIIVCPVAVILLILPWNIKLFNHSLARGHKMASNYHYTVTLRNEKYRFLKPYRVQFRGSISLALYSTLGPQKLDTLYPCSNAHIALKV